MVLVVVVGLLVAVDRIAVALAQGRVEQELDRQEEVAQADEVDIHGFPFLTQLFSGSYGEVDVDLTLDESSEIPGTRVQLTLLDVTAPFSELLSGSPDVEVDRVEGSATLPYDVVAAQIGPNTTLEPDSDGLRITRTVSLLGLEAPLSAAGTVTVEDGNVLLISVEEAEAVGVEVPEVFLSEGIELLNVRYQLPAPPFDLQVTDVSAGRNGVVVGLEAASTVLAN